MPKVRDLLDDGRATVSGMPTVVACLGSSSTAAKGSYDWIADLRGRPENAAVTLLNFGVGGDLAFNARERLPAVLRPRPDKLVVLVGGNDVLTRASTKLKRFLGTWKRLPRDPSAPWFEQNLRQIVRDAKRRGAHVALCSLVPIGEAPDSGEPFQMEINRLLDEYVGIIQRISHDEGATYVPVYERLLGPIRASPGRALRDIEIVSMYRDAFRLLVLRWSVDKIAERNGWRFHTDGIHLNTHGGRIVADTVQEFVMNV
jgi:lysophospholipase L1-like esterase